MRKIWLIIKREYIVGVRSKGFIIGTILVPLMGVGLFVLVLFLANRQPSQTFRLAILDNAGGLAPVVSRGLGVKLANGQPEFPVVQAVDRPASPDPVEEDLRSKINAGSLDGFLLIPRDLSQPIELHTKNSGDFALLGPLTNALNEALVEARLTARGIHVDDLTAISKSADLRVIRVTRSGESVERGQTIAVAIGLVVLLYMSLLLYGIWTMRSVLEEKTTRTMEVLISAVQPFQLLTGKILGVAGVAFTQLLIWMLSLGLLLAYGSAMAAMNGSSFPVVHLPASLLILTGLFFIGGYFLYCAMFAAIGAACSSDQDAHSLQWLAMAPLVFAMCIYSLILSDPSSHASILLSEIPFLSPILMPLRIALQTPSFWQIALSIILLFLTTVGVIYASAKVYRIGVLMYGKRPTLPELMRWLRYS